LVHGWWLLEVEVAAVGGPVAVFDSGGLFGWLMVDGN